MSLVSLFEKTLSIKKKTIIIITHIHGAKVNAFVY
jgi:hypothetical protein